MLFVNQPTGCLKNPAERLTHSPPSSLFLESSLQDSISFIPITFYSTVPLGSHGPGKRSVIDPWPLCESTSLVARVCSKPVHHSAGHQTDLGLLWFLATHAGSYWILVFQQFFRTLGPVLPLVNTHWHLLAQIFSALSGQSCGALNQSPACSHWSCCRHLFSPLLFRSLVWVCAVPDCESGQTLLHFVDYGGTGEGSQMY